jgi:hypothetical protein
MKWMVASAGSVALLALALIMAHRAGPPFGPASRAPAGASGIAPPAGLVSPAEPAQHAGRTEQADAAQRAPLTEPRAEDRATPVRWVRFEGACDASGAVAVDERHFAVADDEDNVLRVYDARLGGEAVHKTNLSKQIALKKKGEADIEAATSLDGRAFWLTSHGRTAHGVEDPNRSLFITTELPTLDERVEVHGEVYRDLLGDLTHAPALARYDLQHASELAPKEPGGLNIEGLTATPDGQLLIGFRSPVPGGKALILPLENPEALYTSGKPRFGVPIELDLAGLGVRSLSWWHGTYLIAAGPSAGSGPARLYRWGGAGTLPRLAAESVFAGANPEAFFTAENNDEILVLSDDGSRRIDGKACKKLKRKHKSFRGLWLKLAVDKS